MIDPIRQRGEEAVREGGGHPWREHSNLVKVTGQHTHMQRSGRLARRVERGGGGGSCSERALLIVI